MIDFNVYLLQFCCFNSVTDYCNHLYAHNLYPLINKSTRITASSATQIYNNFTDDVNSTTRGAVVMSDVPDHNHIILQKPNSHGYCNPIVITYRIYNDRNKQNVKEALRAYDFNDSIMIP